MPELTQCKLGSTTNWLEGFRAPRLGPSTPPLVMSLKTDWAVHVVIPAPMWSSPSLCSERVSPRSREHDLVMKTLWQRLHRQAAAGFVQVWGRVLPRACSVCLEWICGVALPTTRGRAAVPAQRDHRALPTSHRLSFPFSWLPFFHSAGPYCFQRSLYICYESLFLD